MGWDPGQALVALPSPTQSLSPLAFWLLSSWGASRCWTRMRPPGRFAWGRLPRRTAWLEGLMAVPQPFPTAGCCDGPSEPLFLPACPLALAVTWDPGRLGSEHSGPQWRAPSSTPRCRCPTVLQFAVLERSMMDPDLRSGQAPRRYLQLPEEGLSVSLLRTTHGIL